MLQGFETRKTRSKSRYILSLVIVPQQADECRYRIRYILQICTHIRRLGFVSTVMNMKERRKKGFNDMQGRVLLIS